MHAIGSGIMTDLGCPNIGLNYNYIMGVRCHKTQTIYRYFSLRILPDSHERLYKMRDWDSLQVLVLPYESLVWMKPVHRILYPDGAWTEH